MALPLRISGPRTLGEHGATGQQRNRVAAERFERAKRQEAKAAPVLARPKTFADAAADFVRWCFDVEYRRRPSTARRIKDSMWSLVRCLGDIPVHQITPADVEIYKEQRIVADRVKDVTVKHDLDNLSVFFRKYAIRRGLAASNPCDDVTRPSDADAVRMHILTADEESKYFAEAARIPNLYDPHRLILLQGCRPEEVLSLKRSDVDLEKKTIKIRGGKTRSARRTLYLLNESAAIFKRRLEASESDWLFRRIARPGITLRRCRLRTTAFV